MVTLATITKTSRSNSITSRIMDYLNDTNVDSAQVTIESYRSDMKQGVETNDSLSSERRVKGGALLAFAGMTAAFAAMPLLTALAAGAGVAFIAKSREAAGDAALFSVAVGIADEAMQVIADKASSIAEPPAISDGDRQKM